MTQSLRRISFTYRPVPATRGLKTYIQSPVISDSMRSAKSAAGGQVLQHLAAVVLVQAEDERAELSEGLVSEAGLPRICQLVDSCQNALQSLRHPCLLFTVWGYYACGEYPTQALSCRRTRAPRRARSPWAVATWRGCAHCPRCLKALGCKRSSPGIPWRRVWGGLARGLEIDEVARDSRRVRYKIRHN